jgi:hypothetical protein
MWVPSEYDMYLAKNREACKMMVDKFEEEGLAVESRFVASQREPESSDDGKCFMCDLF